MDEVKGWVASRLCEELHAMAFFVGASQRDLLHRDCRRCNLLVFSYILAPVSIRTFKAFLSDFHH